MSKSLKEMYAVPEWMRQFLPSFINTGGNDVEELLHDEDTNMFANSVRYMLIVSARSQFALLMDMYSKGIITGRTGATECSDTLTDGQLLFRLQDFYGAGQDATEINDHEYAQECTDVVSIIREVIESRRKMKAAEKRIAELERDETQLVPGKVPSPELLCQFVMSNYANYQGSWLCGKSSEIVSYLLNMAGYACEKVPCTIEGIGHLYVRCGDLNLDPSIKQFGDYPEISRGVHPCAALNYFEDLVERSNTRKEPLRQE